MKDFLASSRDSSPGRERSSLSLSAVKSLMLRDKDDKFKPEFGDDENKVVSLIQSLFDPDRSHQKRNMNSCYELVTSSSLPREIHGAPLESFILQISEIIGTFKTLRNMALFWLRIVNELRRLWYEEQYIPGIPFDDVPDLGYCLLYQQLQVINTCLSRKKRRDIATEALDNMIREASRDSETLSSSESNVPSKHLMYARVASGELVLRLGADFQCDGLTMLETGEPVYSPITQEGPLLTEDVIRETEEFVLRTGSVGAGCSQLLSDMQAFKAANPGCLLEDFVRWHSPPDWTNTKQNSDPDDSCYEVESAKGQLSSRMQKEGNLWRELWETSKPVPAYKQAPLFDEDLAVEGILNQLEDTAPSALFEQLFVSLVGLGIVLSESILSSSVELLKLFTECKDYIVATFQNHSWPERIDDLCQVYETIETMLVNPEEVMKIMKQQEEAATTPGEQSKRRFRRLSLYFGRDKQSKRPPPSSKDQKAAEEPMRQSFSNFFDSKSSLFSRKPPRSGSASASPTPSDKPTSSDDRDWTLV
uniref:Rab3GAP catalytic subunit conserved domain-containing protein n=1 Tax=Kalanchoe fedtschenkoi TaxID=63787 RepID=A0A7N0UW69_KALFE